MFTGTRRKLFRLVRNFQDMIQGTSPETNNILANKADRQNLTPHIVCSCQGDSFDNI